MPRYAIFAASSCWWMPKTPHMAFVHYHGGLIAGTNLWIPTAWLTFFVRATTSLARCAGHRGISRPGLRGDPGGPGDGLCDPDRRCDGVAPSRARVLGRRRL